MGTSKNRFAFGGGAVGITRQFGKNGFFAKPQSNSVSRDWCSLKQRKIVQLEVTSVADLSKVQS
jgi:ribosomal protein L15